MIARHPSDPDNAAPDWMCISRGRFRDPSNNLNSYDIKRKERCDAERARLRTSGYTPIGEWSRAHGVAFKSAVQLCVDGIMGHEVVQGSYWIAPGASA